LSSLDITGYIASVTPTKTSAKRNQYFDIDLQTSPAECRKVRIMENKAAKRSIFVQRCEEKSPVRLSKLSTSKNILFFNGYSGSRLDAIHQLDFCFTERAEVVEVTNIEDQTGSFTVIGRIKWVSDSKFVDVGPNKVKKEIRDAVFADGTGFIPFSVWGNSCQELQHDITYKFTKVVVSDYKGKQLNTTSDTEVEEVEDLSCEINWNNAPSEIERPSKTVRGGIISCILTRYITCTKETCKKKVLPIPDDSLVSCNSCNSKMKVSKCNSVVSATVTILDDEQQQHTCTMFQGVISHLFQANPTDEEVENVLLDMEDVTLEMNNRDVVISIENND